MPPSGTEVLIQMHDMNHRNGKISKCSKKRKIEDVESSTNEELTEDVNIRNIDSGVFEDADNFYDDDDVEESWNDDDIMKVSTHRVVEQLWKKKSIFF